MAARDRLVLGLGAGLVALMFGWAFVWYPLAQGQASLAAKLGTAAPSTPSLAAEAVAAPPTAA